MEGEQITYFAYTDHRNKRVKFGIKASDRTRHMYVIGKTGMGKSTLLENMAVQDIQNGNGIAFMDPHGKTADLFLDYIPENRIDDVVYFAPFDTENPISFNVMEDVDPDKRFLVVNGLMSAFKKIWVDAWSARMEYILNNVLLALIEYPDSTLLGVNRMLSDKDYRNAVVENISDPAVKSFWVDEFAKYGDRYMQEAGAAIQNKIGQFTANPLVRNIIGQKKSSFDIRKMMDEKKILLINLSKGQVGEANANLLGSMLITKIYLGAMSRADVSDTELQKLPNFYFYVDEFQSFANESFADILSEARKYKLNLTIAHQYIEQMSEEVRAAVFGNVGTLITFRVGSFDAQIFEKEFAPYFYADDMVNLGFAQIYLRLMIDGIGSTPFSATTMEPIAKRAINFRNEVVKSSRDNFSAPRRIIEEEILQWHQKSFAKPKENRNNRPQNDAYNSKPDFKDSRKGRGGDRINSFLSGKSVADKYTKEKSPSENYPPLPGKNSLKDALLNLSKNKEKEDLPEDKKILEKKDLSLKEDSQKNGIGDLKSAVSNAVSKENESNNIYAIKKNVNENNKNSVNTEKLKEMLSIKKEDLEEKI